MTLVPTKPSNQILKMYKIGLTSNPYRILPELEKTQNSCWITLLSSQLGPCVDRVMRFGSDTLGEPFIQKVLQS